MQIKAVLFDLDGVLVSTDEYHYIAWKECADRLGIPFEESTNNRLRGVSRMESLEIILECSGAQLSLEEKIQLCDFKNEIYRKHLTTLTPNVVEAGTRLLLFDLREANIKTAVASSSKNAGIILAKTLLDNQFNAVVDGNCITHSKPDPEVFLKASVAVGVPPENCLVVEDAKAGVEAGIAAGMRVAGIGDAADCDGVDISLDALEHLMEVITSIV